MESQTGVGSTFEQKPVVLAMVQSDNGGQKALHPEVKDVTQNGADVRYCESDGWDNHTAGIIARSGWSSPETSCVHHSMTEVQADAI